MDGVLWIDIDRTGEIRLEGRRFTDLFLELPGTIAHGAVAFFIPSPRTMTIASIQPSSSQPWPISWIREPALALECFMSIVFPFTE